MGVMGEGELPSFRIPAILRNYKIPILLGGISLFSIVLSIVLLVKSTQTATPIRFSGDEASGSALGATILVDVEGAVLVPGVYTLPAGSRVEDAIVAAGGVGGNVDEEQFAKIVNRAAKISDGMKVYVPRIDANQTSHIINSEQNDPGNDGLVSVNFATQQELESLSGVGPVTAKKIIDNRPYQTLSELMTKKAMGASLYEKLKDSLSL